MIWREHYLCWVFRQWIYTMPSTNCRIRHPCSVIIPIRSRSLLTPL
jgi:hypothetical protein